jgi:hypothetical protein
MLHRVSLHLLLQRVEKEQEGEAVVVAVQLQERQQQQPARQNPILLSGVC